MTHPALAFSVRTPPGQRASCLIQSLLQTDLQEQQRLLRSKLLIVISLISRVAKPGKKTSSAGPKLKRPAVCARHAHASWLFINCLMYV